MTDDIQVLMCVCDVSVVCDVVYFDEVIFSDICQTFYDEMMSDVVFGGGGGGVCAVQ